MRASLEFQLQAIRPQLFKKIKTKGPQESEAERKKREEEWRDHIEQIL